MKIELTPIGTTAVAALTATAALLEANMPSTVAQGRDLLDVYLANFILAEETVVTHKVAENEAKFFANLAKFGDTGPEVVDNNQGPQDHPNSGGATLTAQIVATTYVSALHEEGLSLFRKVSQAHVTENAGWHRFTRELLSPSRGPNVAALAFA